MAGIHIPGLSHPKSEPQPPLNALSICSANLRSAIARKAARVAAVEYRDEVGVVGQLRIQAAELSIRDRMLL